MRKLIMDSLVNTCACCKFIKTESWPDSLPKVEYMIPPENYVCSNPKSPMFGGCVIGSWGCIYSSVLSPEIKMPNGERLGDFLGENGK